MGSIVPKLGISKFGMMATSIGDALFTKTQQKVLGLLFGKPDKRFYTNEIMRWAAMGRGTVSRELDRLVRAGLLSTTKQGNQNYYQANANNPVYEELVGIVKKTFGVADQIRDILIPSGENIELAFIYGSIAKGTERNTSDIDLMLVGENLSYGRVVEVLQPLEESLQRTINPTIYERKDFVARLKDGDSFVSRVIGQPKIFIKGSEDGIRGGRARERDIAKKELKALLAVASEHKQGVPMNEQDRLVIGGEILISRAALEELAQRHHICRLVLFGSAARGELKADSDIDLLVEFESGEAPSLGGMVEIQEALVALFGGRTVDVATPSILNNPYRRRAIEKNMEELYAA